MKKVKTFKPPRSITRLFPQVKKVVHARQPVLVDVRQQDCDEGKKLQTSECALAKATKRQFKADGVAIRLSDSFIIKGNTAIRFKTPETVKREIVSFDRHKDFAPGSYRLSATPPDWDKPGKRHSEGSGGDKDTRRKHKHFHHTVRVRTVDSKEAS